MEIVVFIGDSWSVILISGVSGDKWGGGSGSGTSPCRSSLPQVWDPRPPRAHPFEGTKVVGIGIKTLAWRLGHLVPNSPQTSELRASGVLVDLRSKQNLAVLPPPPAKVRTPKHAPYCTRGLIRESSITLRPTSTCTDPFGRPPERVPSKLRRTWSCSARVSGRGPIMGRWKEGTGETSLETMKEPCSWFLRSLPINYTDEVGVAKNLSALLNPYLDVQHGKHKYMLTYNLRPHKHEHPSCNWSPFLPGQKEHVYWTGSKHAFMGWDALFPRLPFQRETQSSNGNHLSQGVVARRMPRPIKPFSRNSAGWSEVGATRRLRANTQENPDYPTKPNPTTAWTTTQTHTT